MFDYYALPRDWPGRADASHLPWAARASHVETELQRDISAAIGSSFNPAQFIPYVQLHEFESLLFADPRILAQVAADICGRRAADLQRHFEAIVREAGSPEAIDDGHDTCPSRRVTGLVSGFRKGLHSPMVARNIGLPTLAAACPHFGQWVCMLEALGETTAGVAVD